MDLPGHATIVGEWDLRGHEADYLGHVNLAGKRVLEIGPASGHLTFWMEAQGAEVVAFDLGPNDDGPVVPYTGVDLQAQAARQAAHRQLVTNSWWYARQALGAKARRAEGTVYELPAELGTFNLVTFSAVLLHLRDPMLALQRALAMTTETLIVTDVDDLGAAWWRRKLRRYSAAHMNYLPDARTGTPVDGWWGLNPDVLARMVAVLGFGRPRVTYHKQHYTGGGRTINNFTMVAPRVTPGPAHHPDERKT